MNHRTLAALLLLLACPAALAQIKVGALFNVTGDVSSIDDPGLAGFKLAAAQLNAEGGVSSQQLEIVATDGKTDQTQLTNAASRLVDVEGVVAVRSLENGCPSEARIVATARLCPVRMYLYEAG